MRILLDTQCWLWMLASPERLSRRAKKLIQLPGTEVYLSAASAWEIAIKYGLGKLQLPADPTEYVTSRLASSGVLPLPIRHAHALHVARLPPHHRDPFDRLLIAQAQIERLTLMSADRQMKPYEIKIEWAADRS
jgi:PIN domain nuclease of toxin-antitoxin system